MTHTHERRQHGEASRYADVQVELTRLVFDNLMGTVAIGFVGVVSALFFMAFHYPDSFLWWLGAAAFLTSCGRMTVIYLFSREPRLDMGAAEAGRWELAYGTATMLYTLSFAINTLYCFRYHDNGARNWAAIGTFAFSSGISGRLALRPWIAQVSGLIMLAALAYSLMRSEDVLVRCSVFAVLLYIYLYCTSISVKFDILVDKIRAQRQLAELAERDALTGLANRRSFENRLALACRLGVTFAILFIDLDKFKAVNDLYGHATGDALLQSAARRLLLAVRESDLVARLGGDEFAVLQAAPATAATAETLAARINRDMASSFEIEGRQLQIAASIGIRLAAADEADAPVLLRSADTALYEVKRMGGGSFTLAGPVPSGTLSVAS